MEPSLSEGFEYPTPGSEIKWSGAYGEPQNTRVINWRSVVNDAVVGPWKPFDGEVAAHSIEGLKLWMMENQSEGWVADKLACRGWAPNVFDYGYRLQFWMPEKDAEDGCAKMRCIDATGCDSLTDGKVYKVVGVEGELISVIDDTGHSKEFFVNRFKSGA
jgi:hypothetical protein